MSKKKPLFNFRNILWELPIILLVLFAIGIYVYSNYQDVQQERVSVAQAQVSQGASRIPKSVLLSDVPNFYLDVDLAKDPSDTAEVLYPKYDTLPYYFGGVSFEWDTLATTAFYRGDIRFNFPINIALLYAENLIVPCDGNLTLYVHADIDTILIHQPIDLQSSDDQEGLQFRGPDEATLPNAYGGRKYTFKNTTKGILGMTVRARPALMNDEDGNEGYGFPGSAGVYACTLMCKQKID